MQFDRAFGFSILSEVMFGFHHFDRQAERSDRGARHMALIKLALFYDDVMKALDPSGR